MGIFVTFCTLLIGGALAAGTWLLPDSVIMWFASTSPLFMTLRAGVMVLLAGLLVADAYADDPRVRRAASMVGLLLLGVSAQVLLYEPVYMLDFLFLLNASVCFGIMALQREGEMRELPSLPDKSAAPVYVTVASVFGRLQQPPPRRLRLSRLLLPAADLRDDSHCLTVPMPHAQAQH